MLNPSASTAESVTALRAQNAALQDQVQQLKNQIEWFKRQLFGPTSERRVIQDPQQGDISELLAEAPIPATEWPTETVTYQRRKASKRPEDDDGEGLRFDDTVPVETIEVPVPELVGAEVADYEVIDEKVSHRLAQRPGSYVVLQYRRKVVKHRPSGKIITPPAPDNVLERSLADVSFLAGLLVDKFAYHQPLYRQHQRLADNGITVSRTTLTHLVHRSAALLEPIHDAQRRSILRSKVLAMDETPIKAGRKRKGRMRQGYYWPIYGEADEIAFCYSEDRGQHQVKTWLGEDFRGTLLSDGDVAYEKYAERRDGVTHALCWAHARRSFIKAETVEPQAVTEALQWIQALYQQERLIAGQDAAERLHHRAQHSQPLVEGFFAWCHEQRQRIDLTPTNPLAKALHYVGEREAGLKAFLSDPHVPIDTNHLERALRVIPMGKKNWLFCWTEIGAKYVGIVQSLIVTCRLHGINPYTYLVDVLQRVGQHPAVRVDELTPRLWKQHFAHDPLRSDLEKLELRHQPR